MKQSGGEATCFSGCAESPNADSEVLFHEASDVAQIPQNSEFKQSDTALPVEAAVAGSLYNFVTEFDAQVVDETPKNANWETICQSVRVSIAFIVNDLACRFADNQSGTKFYFAFRAAVEADLVELNDFLRALAHEKDEILTPEGFQCLSILQYLHAKCGHNAFFWFLDRRLVVHGTKVYVNVFLPSVGVFFAHLQSARKLYAENQSELASELIKLFVLSNYKLFRSAFNYIWEASHNLRDQITAIEQLYEKIVLFAETISAAQTWSTWQLFLKLLPRVVRVQIRNMSIYWPENEVSVLRSVWTLDKLLRVSETMFFSLGFMDVFDSSDFKFAEVRVQSKESALDLLWSLSQSSMRETMSQTSLNESCSSLNTSSQATSDLVSPASGFQENPSESFYEQLSLIYVNGLRAKLANGATLRMYFCTRVSRIT